MENSKKSIPYLQEQKTETNAAFQAAFALIGICLSTDDEYKFYASLGSALLLLIIGMIQRTHLKIAQLHFRFQSDLQEKTSTEFPAGKNTSPKGKTS